ncbi:MAG TPA: hypothetical protein DDX29_12140 [Clostridiales bacterium]|nr:hypothetical protein [Clostridiales bacterium]
MEDQRLYEILAREGDGNDVPYSYPSFFSTWDGFGWLWERAQEKKFFTDFIEWYLRKQLPKRYDMEELVLIIMAQMLHLIHPQRFCEALKTFLKERV